MVWNNNKKIIIFKAFFLAGLTLLVSGCFSPESVTRNIRVIAQAEVDGEIVEGSAVMGLRWEAGSNGRMYNKNNVEAVILELGKGKTVYITHSYISLDGTSNSGYWMPLVLKTFGMSGNGKLSDLPKLSSLEGRYPVKPLVGSRKKLPVMVSFSDEKKRETMFQVEPHEFSKVFGDNVRFLGLWFEFTEDLETELIIERLPVMFEVNESYHKAFPKRDKNGNLIPTRDAPLPRKLGKISFYQRSY